MEWFYTWFLINKCVPCLNNLRNLSKSSINFALVDLSLNRGVLFSYFVSSFDVILA